MTVLREHFATGLANSSPIITAPSSVAFRQKWSQTGILVCYFLTVGIDTCTQQPSSKSKGRHAVVKKCACAEHRDNRQSRNYFNSIIWMSKIPIQPSHQLIAHPQGLFTASYSSHQVHSTLCLNQPSSPLLSLQNLPPRHIGLSDITPT